MNIQKIGQGAIAIYIEKNELNQYGFEPTTLDCNGARRILVNAKEETGMTNWTDVELDVFPGNSSVLLFARICKMRPVFFAFDNLEQLLDGISQCADDKTSHLTYLDNTYILSMYVKDGEEPAVCLREFGRLLDLPLFFAEHLEEHGSRLVSWDAISVLKKYF